MIPYIVISYFNFIVNPQSQEKWNNKRLHICNHLFHVKISISQISCQFYRNSNMTFQTDTIQTIKIYFDI